MQYIFVETEQEQHLLVPVDCRRKKCIRKPQLASHLRAALNKAGLYKEKLQTGVNSWLGEQEIVPHNINFVIVVCVCWCILCSCSAYDVHLGDVSNISQQPKLLKKTIWLAFYLTWFSLETFYLFFRLIPVKWFWDFWTTHFHGNHTNKYKKNHDNPFVRDPLPEI